jgi:hypothetical protein
MNFISIRQFALAASSLSLLLAGTVLTGCTVYSADPITATVVDADTGAPIEGVNVVAAWELQGSWNYGDAVGYVNVLESVTDGNGHFSFPSWGPRVANRGKVRLSAPALYIFKSGYRFGVYENNGPSTVNAPSKLVSDWAGKSLKLKPFVGSPKELVESYVFLTSVAIHDLDKNGRIADVPKFICSIAQENQRLTNLGFADALYPNEWARSRGISCQ